MVSDRQFSKIYSRNVISGICLTCSHFLFSQNSRDLSNPIIFSMGGGGESNSIRIWSLNYNEFPRGEPLAQNRKGHIGFQIRFSKISKSQFGLQKVWKRALKLLGSAKRCILPYSMVMTVFGINCCSLKIEFRNLCKDRIKGDQADFLRTVHPLFPIPWHNYLREKFEKWIWKSEFTSSSDADNK